MTGIELELFGPKAVKLDGIIIPADELEIDYLGGDPNGPLLDVNWLTPIENHDRYKLAHFWWSDEGLLLEGPKYSFIRDPYVTIEFMSDIPDEEFHWTTPLLTYQGKQYYHWWAELLTGEGDIKDKWVDKINKGTF